MHKEKGPSPDGGYKAPAVHKAFEVLRAVAHSQGGLRIVEISSLLGYSMSTTHGLVHALLREGALTQHIDSPEFYLGPLVANLAFLDWNYIRVNKLAQPILDELRDLSGATVFLGARVGGRVMITASAEAMHPFKISARIGTAIPLLAGAVGKVLLAQDPPGEVFRLIQETGLPRFTPRSIAQKEAYMAELSRVRTQGYAIDDEEYILGVRAVAVALNNPRGLPMAIWVVGIVGNMEPEKLNHLSDMALLAAAKLSSRLEERRDPGLGPAAPRHKDNLHPQTGSAKKPTAASSK